MANYNVSSSDLTNVADAIRTKGGTSASLSFPNGFISAVAAIPAVITGTFTGATSEKGTAKSITVPYSGTGYPIWILIYPTTGAYKSGTDIYASTQTKAIILFAGAKCDVSLAPDYTESTIQNKMFAIASYKNSSTNNTTVSSGYNSNVTAYFGYAASGTGASAVVRFYNSATNLSVYIAPDGGAEYGFLAGTEYTYVIQYSS